MDTLTFNLLCEASQISFPEAEKEDFMRRLDSIIDFAGAVKQFDCDCSTGEDLGSVRLDDLREDTAAQSLPPEKLLANTQPLFNCYVIPKLME
ncbi:MAG: aspartyl/glutamyl-tRNA amidotransferase subunit C [Oscillospiraceae bacterium]|jgi:Asp-tRNA(Asn)/Glu-tRNA(Gln) amidotransferase C subunit|nr:aspartyl/glutamyl-tRNA amidotransferase subunit C [Oscillospiraceae bacterium]